MAIDTRALADIAMQAAVDALLRRGIDPRTADCEAVCRELRAQLESTLDEALADGRRALEAGMDSVATATVVAALKLCGIRAVEAVYGKVA